MNKVTLSISLVVSGILIGAIAASFSPRQETIQDIEWLATARPVDSFELVSTAGKFSREDFVGYWSLVLFGFLQCPDICPTSPAKLSKLTNKMGAAPTLDLRRGIKTGLPLSVVVVSVDPARDTLMDLHRYVTSFNVAYTGITGEVEQLTRLADSLGVRFTVSGQGVDSLVAHSITISIINPNGELVGRFRPGFDTDRVATALSTL